jgi:hypothetical protein
VDLAGGVQAGQRVRFSPRSLPLTAGRLRLPVSFWKKGLDVVLTMPGMAMLLTVAREKPSSAFAPEP